MATVTIPLLGYAPDLDPAQPGVFSYCLGMESTNRGWRLRREMSTSASIDDTFGTGPWILDGLASGLVDGTERVHIAAYNVTAAKLKLYAYNGTSTLVDVSKTGGYTATAVENFSFCQYGNYTLATDLVDVLQIRDASTANVFADSGATGIPKAKIAVTWGPPTSPRVMLLHYNDGTDTPDGWWSSHEGGPTAAWTPNIATGAANGRLLGAGKLRAGIAFGDDIVAFGDRQMWLGRFVGPPTVVEWTRITDELGCVGPYACKVINGVLYWVGEQGLFMSAGGFPQKVPVPIQNELITTIAGLGTSKRLVQVMADGSGQRLQIAIRGAGYTGGQTIQKWYSINLLNNKVGITPTARFDSAFQCCLDRKYACYFATDGKLTLAAEGTGPIAATAVQLFGFGLNYIGSNKGDTRLVSVRPRWIAAPSSYLWADYHGATMDAVTTAVNGAVPISASPWRVDLNISDRWHAPRIYLTSNGTVDGEVVDVDVDVVSSGNA